MDVDYVAWADGTVDVQVHNAHVVSSQIRVSVFRGLTAPFGRPEILKMAELNDSSELQIYAVSGSSL